MVFFDISSSDSICDEGVLTICLEISGLLFYGKKNHEKKVVAKAVIEAIARCDPHLFMKLKRLDFEHSSMVILQISLILEENGSNS